MGNNSSRRNWWPHAHIGWLIAAAGLTSGVAAHARPIVNWVVDANGQWTTPANWSSSPALPGLIDDVVIDRPAGGFEVTLSSGAQTINSLLLNERLQLAGGILDVAATAMINNTVTLAGGTLSGGVWSGAPAAVVTQSSTLSGLTWGLPLTVNSGQSLVIRNGLTLNATAMISLAGDSPTSMIFGGTQTLSGTGFITFNGVSDANAFGPEAAGQTLTIGSGILVRSGDRGGDFGIAGATINLAGVLRSAGPRTVTVRGTLNFTGAGNAQTTSGGVIILDAATVRGGLFDGVGTVFANNNSLLDGVSFDTGLTVNAGQVVRIENGLFIDGGAVRLGGTNGAPSVVQFDGTQTLDGPGTVTFNGLSNANFLVSSAATDVLTISPSVTIRSGTSGGTVGRPDGATINRGIILSTTVGSVLTFNGTGNQNFGTLRAVSGGVLALVGSLQLNGTSVQVANQGVVRLGGVALSNGSITGVGTAEMTADSTLAGLTIGVPLTVGGGVTATIQDLVTVQSTLALSPTSELNFVIGGTVAGTDFGVFIIVGGVTLAGELRVSLSGGFQPVWNDRFTIMSAGAIAGDLLPRTFPPLTDPAWRWWAEFTPTTLEVGVRHFADGNRDGAVDFGDISFVLGNFGLTGSGLFADANENGAVDFGDIVKILASFGAQAP